MFEVSASLQHTILLNKMLELNVIMSKIKSIVIYIHGEMNEFTHFYYNFPEFIIVQN